MSLFQRLLQKFDKSNIDLSAKTVQTEVPLLPIAVDSAAQIEFFRVGNDLVIKVLGDSQQIRDYFLKPVALKTIDGEILSIDDIVSSLSYPTQPVLLAANGEIEAIGSAKAIQIGTITKIVEGPIMAQTQGGASRTLNEGDPVYQHDIVSTVARSYVKITLEDGTVFQLGPLSRMSLDKYAFDSQNSVGEVKANIFSGFFRYISGKISGKNEGEHTVIQTPSADIGIRGSEIEARIEPDGSLSVLHLSGLINIVSRHSLGEVMVYEPGTVVYIPNNNTSHTLKTLTEEQIQLRIQEWQVLENQEEVEGQLIKSMGGKETAFLGTSSDQGDETASLSPDSGALNPFSPATVDVHSDDSVDNLIREHFEMDAQVRPVTITRVHEESYFNSTNSISELNYLPSVQALKKRESDGITERFDEGLPALDEMVSSVEEAISPTDGTVLPADNPLLSDLTPVPSEKELPSTGESVSLPDSGSQLPKLLSISFNEDNSQIIEAQGVHITNLIQPQHGSVFNNEDGTLIYTPRSGFIGEDNFSYSLNGQNFIEVPVTVKPMQIEIPESRLVAELTQPEHGRIIDNGDGTLTYSPNPDFYGDDFFTVTVQDQTEPVSQGFSILQVDEANTIRVELSITATNDVPQGVDDTGSSQERATSEDTPLVIAPAVLLQNDINVDDDILSIQNVQSSELTYGQVSLNSAGEVVYLPTANFHGQAEFFYTVQDDAGVSDAKATRVTVMVSPSDDMPVALADTFVVSNTNRLDMPTAVLLKNDQELDGETLRIVGVKNPSGGTVHFDSNEEIGFVPETDFVTGGFDYIVSDGQHTDVAQVIITRDNFQPIAQDDELKLDPEQVVAPVTIQANQLLANDMDPENDRLSIIRVNDDSGDNVAMDNRGNIIFTPNDEFIDSGLSHFTYQVSDDKGNTADASVTVVLADIIDEGTNPPGSANQQPPVNEDDKDDIVDPGDVVPVDTSNEPPTAKDDNIETHTPPDPILISISELLKNDTDPDNDTLSLTVLDEDRLNGSITDDDPSDDIIVFTPSDSFIDEGFGQWRYEIDDGQGNTTTALVTVTLINDPPVAEDDSFDLGHDEQITITSEALLENDFDSDGDLLTLLITDSSKGQATLNAEGNVIFTRGSEFEGEGGFEYQISDGKGGVATAQVIITGLVNQDPVANDDRIDEPVPKNQASVLPITFLLDNDFDPDPNDQFSLVEVQNTINSQVEWQEDTDTIIFTPSPGFTGEAAFEYTIEDEQGARATAQVNLEVINTPPVAVGDDQFNTLVDASLTIPTSNLLDNDSDANNDDLAVVSVSPTSETHGSVTLGNDNVTFQPEEGFEGEASFNYTIEDSDGAQDTATVTVVVTEKMGTDDTFTISKNTTETIPATELLGNDNGQLPMSIIEVGNVQNGVVQLNSNEDVQFTPNSDFIGEASFEYALRDGLGKTDKATVTITVENTPPIAQDDVINTTENIAVNIPTADLLSNDRDDDIGDEELTLTAVKNANHGTVELNGNGDEILFTPEPSFAGEASFEYTIADNSGAEATATVMVTVDPANLPPEITLPNSSTPLVYNIYDNPLPIDNAATVADPDSADFESGILQVTITTNKTSNDVLEIQNQDHISVSNTTGGEIFFDGNPIGNFSTHFLTGALLINLNANADQEATASLLQTITYNNTSTEPSTDTRTVEITLSDGDGGTSAVASRDIEVTTLDPPPIAVDDNIAIPFNLSTTFPVEELLTNDSDPNPNDQLSISEVSSANPEEVNVTLLDQEIQLFIDGLLNEHFDPVTFDYTVSDDNGGESSATVTVTPTNVITGTPNADDDLKGTEQLDIILGQAGNDTFAPNVGPDILLGGDGDDIFLFDPDVAAGVHLKGNEGIDTLKFTSTGKQFDLTRNTALPSDQQVDLQEIEKIDLGENELRLSIADVLDISGSNNQLIIEGNLNSGVTSVGQDWNFRDTDTSGLYNRYTNGDAELLVSVDIARQFVS